MAALRAWRSKFAATSVGLHSFLPCATIGQRLEWCVDFGRGRGAGHVAPDCTCREEQESIVSNHYAEEHLFRVASEAARVVSYQRDYESDSFSFVGRGIEGLTGYSAEEFTPALWSSLVLEIVPTGITAGLTEDEARCRGIRERHETWQADYRIRHRNGSEKWLACSAAVKRDETGEPIESIGLLADITERKELEARLLRVQRMETIGILAGGLAHNFNNIMSVILGHVDLLSEQVEDAPGAAQDIERIRISIRRAVGLSHQLLAVSRRQLDSRKEIQVFPLINRIAHDLRLMLRSDVRITTSVEAGLPAIWGSELGIEQAMMDLVLNARDALSHGKGTITLAGETEEVTELRPTMQTDMPPGRYVCLSVTDDGDGMTPEVLDHIFDVFFTTKDPGQNTGVGLTMVYSTVRNHGGYIMVSSEPGKGSCFSMYFPTIRATDGPPSASDLDALPKGEGTLLVVDDDYGVVEMMESLLSRLGYNVLTATSGHEAAKSCWRSDQDVDLMILDQVMPGLNGEETLRMIATKRPNLPCLVVTGCESDEDLRGLRQMAGVRGILQKPVRASEIANAISAILGEG